MIDKQDVFDSLVFNEVSKTKKIPVYYFYDVHEQANEFIYSIACTTGEQITGNIFTISKQVTRQFLIDQVSKSFEFCLNELGVV